MKTMLRVSLCVGAAIAVWRNKTVIANAEFLRPVRLASGSGSYIHNVIINNNPASGLIFEASKDT